jgi:type I restriction-modification system DNA methylase subunit
MDAAEYRHVVLGLIFLKFISDTFEEKLRWLTAKLEEQFAESARLEKAIRKNLRGFGYGS